MNSYRAVFCDIDGTLLTSDHHISPATIKAIHSICDRKIPFILVSARMPAAIYPIQKELGINGPIISYGGALILDETGSVIESTGISLYTADEIQKTVPPETNEYRFCLYSGDHWIVSDDTNPIILRESEITKVTPTKIAENIKEFHKLMCFGPSVLLDQISSDLKAKFPSCAVYKSFHNLLEIMDGQVSKSKAVHRLCESLGISPQDSIAFGDNYNDVDMLLSVGLGIAMGNAPEDVKKKAAAVTADNDHDGIALALEKLFP